VGTIRGVIDELNQDLEAREGNERF
jgi:hypothetical protein